MDNYQHTPVGEDCAEYFSETVIGVSPSYAENMPPETIQDLPCDSQDYKAYPACNDDAVPTTAD